MSYFTEEIRIIPSTARFLSALAYVVLLAVLWFTALSDPSIARWPLAGKIAFAVCVPLPLIFYVLGIGYIYADAKRRGMRHVLWTFLAALIPNAIGIILYFVLREPLLVPCVSCGLPAKAGFAFCPRCGSALARACPQCRRGVEPDWANCAYCGIRLG